MVHFTDPINNATLKERWRTKAMLIRTKMLGTLTVLRPILTLPSCSYKREVKDFIVSLLIKIKDCINTKVIAEFKEWKGRKISCIKGGTIPML